MTIEMLNQYQAICREIPDLKDRIGEVKRRSAGHAGVKASMDVFPYTPYTLAVDGADREDEQETLRMMRRRLRRISRMRREIEQYIDGIGDSQLRQVFYLRFVDGLSWEKVTVRLGREGDGSTERKRVSKYLKVSRLSRPPGSIIEA